LAESYQLGKQKILAGYYVVVSDISKRLTINRTSIVEKGWKRVDIVDIPGRMAAYHEQYGSTVGVARGGAFNYIRRLCNVSFHTAKTRQNISP